MDVWTVWVLHGLGKPQARHWTEGLQACVFCAVPLQEPFWLKALYVHTMVTWTMFPVVRLLALWGYMTQSQEEMGFTLLDLVVKLVYAKSLMQFNNAVLDLHVLDKLKRMQGHLREGVHTNMQVRNRAALKRVERVHIGCWCSAACVGQCVLVTRLLEALANTEVSYQRVAHVEWNPGDLCTCCAYLTLSNVGNVAVVALQNDAKTLNSAFQAYDDKMLAYQEATRWREDRQEVEALVYHLAASLLQWWLCCSSL